MSIDDDYFDIEEHLRKSDISGAWDRYANHTAALENENDAVLKQNKELRIAIRVMMNIKEENNNG